MAACVRLLLVSLLPLLELVSANLPAGRPASTTKPSVVSIFRDFDAEPVNFPASPKMYIEQLVATPRAMIIEVWYSDTSQELLSYNISYQPVSEETSSREQAVHTVPKRLPNQFDLQDLSEQTKYNVCVRASFKPGDFSLYTMQNEKVRNCTLLSTAAEPLQASGNASVVAVCVLLGYAVCMLLLVVLVYKLRRRYCKDSCLWCAWLDQLVSAVATECRSKWRALRAYLLRLGAGSVQAPNLHGNSSQSTQNARCANEAVNASTYVSVPQTESVDRSKSTLNHSEECEKPAQVDVSKQTSELEFSQREAASVTVSNQTVVEYAAERKNYASVTVTASESAATTTTSTSTTNAVVSVDVANLNGVATSAELSKSSKVSENEVLNSHDVAVPVESDFQDHRAADSEMAENPVASQSQRDFTSSEQEVPISSFAPRENGSKTPSERTSNKPNVIKSSTGNTAITRPLKPKETSDDSKAIDQNHSARTLPTRTGGKKAVSDRHSESDRYRDEEEVGKTDDKRECPQHGSVILTLNPQTMVIGDQRRKRRERNEQQVVSNVEPRSVDREHERFVRDFYEKLHSDQRSNSVKQDVQAATKDRESGRTAGLSAASAHRKQRISAPMPANDAQQSEPSSVRRKNDATRHGGNEQLSANAADKQRKMRVPLDSLDSDQTDDEVWILRASKV